MPADPRPESRVHPTFVACVTRSSCDAMFAEVERLKRLLKQRGKDAADAEDEVERLKKENDRLRAALGRRIARADGYDYVSRIARGALDA